MTVRLMQYGCQFNAAYLCHTLHGSSHSQNPLMNAGNDFADASLDASLVP